MKILVTGGCGFIGSAVIRHAIERTGHEILNVDKMTYAASRAALEHALDHPRHRLEVLDINEAAKLAGCFEDFQPEAVMHLAFDRRPGGVRCDECARHVQSAGGGAGLFRKSAARAQGGVPVSSCFDR